MNLATGEREIVLVSTVFLSAPSDPARVDGEDTMLNCAVCVDNRTDLRPLAGSPREPKEGVCNGGARAGESCRTTNPTGLTLDCLPGGGSNPDNPDCVPSDREGCTDAFGNEIAALGPIAGDLTPLRTRKLARTAADGRFCPGQDAIPGSSSGQGRFNADLVEQAASSADCRGICRAGRPFGDLGDGRPKNGVVASVFCIPGTPPSW